MSDWSKKFAKKFTELGRKILQPNPEEPSADEQTSPAVPEQPTPTKSEQTRDTPKPAEPLPKKSVAPVPAPEPKVAKETMSETPQAPRQKISDIGQQQVGKIYAQAMLAAAGSADAADGMLAELGAMVNEVFAKAPQLESLLGSPRISIDEKTSLLDKALSSKVSSGMLKFLKVVCNHGRLDCLRAIYNEACSMQNEQKGVIEVEMVTAEAADPKLVSNVKQSLTSKLGSEVDLRVSTDPSLIGGVMVRVGDKVLDASVKQKLKLVREQAVTAAGQKIRSRTSQFAEG